MVGVIKGDHVAKIYDYNRARDLDGDGYVYEDDFIEIYDEFYQAHRQLSVSGWPDDRVGRNFLQRLWDRIADWLL